MGKEIERKFLLADDSWRSMVETSTDIIQWYLSRRPDATIRVRIIGNCARLTVKGINHGSTRNEWEYEIPVEDALEMLAESDMADGSVLRKTRHVLTFKGRTWEIDEFHGSLEGLVIAEVEIETEKIVLDLPPFIDCEVTGDPSYYNSVLAQ